MKAIIPFLGEIWLACLGLKSFQDRCSRNSWASGFLPLSRPIHDMGDLLCYSVHKISAFLLQTYPPTLKFKGLSADLLPSKTNTLTHRSRMNIPSQLVGCLVAPRRRVMLAISSTRPRRLRSYRSRAATISLTAERQSAKTNASQALVSRPVRHAVTQELSSCETSRLYNLLARLAEIAPHQQG